jgi:hypothetical protein
MRDGNSGQRRLTRANRPFGLGDGLILIAGAAVGLAAAQAVASIDGCGLTVPHVGLSWSQDIAQVFADVALWLVEPFLEAWTLTCLILFLRPPRPALRRLWRKPGALACLVAAILMLLMAAVGIVADRTMIPSYFHVYVPLLFGSVHAGAGVASCWMTMLLWNRWRSEPTWLDRLGRLTGAVWIAIAVLVELPALLQ